MNFPIFFSHLIVGVLGLLDVWYLHRLWGYERGPHACVAVAKTSPTEPSPELAYESIYMCVF